MKHLSYVLLLFISQGLFAQSLPKSFMLNSQSAEFSDSPEGNDIGDIIALGDTVVITTGAGISRSSDRGESWSNFLNLAPSDNKEISAMTYSNGVIWTAFLTEEEQLGEMQDAGAGLTCSTDRGNSWISIPQPVDSKTDTLIRYGNNVLKIVPIHTKIGNITYDIAVVNNNVWIASWGGGLRKSSDMGKTWQKIVLPPDTLDVIAPEDKLNFVVSTNDLNEAVFSISAVDSLTLYVGTAGGINKTTDGGNSWRKFTHLNQTKPISGNWVTSLNYNQLTKTLYAASWKAEGESEFYALSFSTDGGESWTTSLEGQKVLSIGFKNEDAIAGTENGVYRSGNMGRTWILPGKIIDSQSKLSLKTNKFYSVDSEGDDIWLGTDFALVRLKENGAMWMGNWRIFMASQALQGEAATYAFPNPFSPDVETAGIKYSIEGTQSAVTIRIFDFGMNLVRTVIQNAQRGNAHEGTAIDFWDGRDESGRIVPNGVYFYRIDFNQGNPLFGKIMVVM